MATQTGHSTSASERWDKASEIPLLALGLLFLFAYATPIIDESLPLAWRAVFEDIEIVTWAAFSIDFIVRLVLANNRRRFLKTHIIDLAAVLLPVLRPLRALRVLSIVFLSTRRLSGILKNRVMSYVVITAVSVWFIAGLAVTDAEHATAGANIHDVWQGWWWAFITMATVGYGDVFPVTLEGRLVAVALVITGIALVGTITAYIASWFAAASRDTELAIKAELDTAEDKIDVLAHEIAELRALVVRLVPIEDVAGSVSSRRERRPTAERTG